MADPIRDVTVSLGDGVHIDVPSLGRIDVDARSPAGDLAIVTHAHTDHLPRAVGQRPVIASTLTAALAAERRSGSEFAPTTHPNVTLLPSGHIAGSRAALIEADGYRILVTGDVTTRDRPGIEGFEPVSADVLVIEATYGREKYRLPPVSAVRDELLAWLDANGDVPVIIFGYALGRAQRLISLLADQTNRPLMTTPDVATLNDIIETHRNVCLPTSVIDPDESPPQEALVVAPAHHRQDTWVQNAIDRQHAVTAGATGWALDSSYQYRRNVDRGFPLSDHSDFEELHELVDAVDPAIVYTHHGFAEDLAISLTRAGYRARSLQRHQPSLNKWA